jgi:hypothetical protein
MSDTKYLRELLETVDVLNPERACERIGEALQELRQVEADRAKDAELIQQLVDALHRFDPSGLFETSEVPLAAAKAAGFKPSDR